MSSCQRQSPTWLLPVQTETHVRHHQHPSNTCCTFILVNHSFIRGSACGVSVESVLSCWHRLWGRFQNLLQETSTLRSSFNLEVSGVQAPKLSASLYSKATAFLLCCLALSRSLLFHSLVLLYIFLFGITILIYWFICPGLILFLLSLFL